MACALAACELVAGIQDKTLVPQEGVERSPGDTWDWDQPMACART
jgi:hypothetical protein